MIASASVVSMAGRYRVFRGLLFGLILPGVLLVGCGGDPDAPGGSARVGVGGGEVDAAPPGAPLDMPPGRGMEEEGARGERGILPFAYAGPVLDDLPPGSEGDGLQHETERDWAVAQGTVAWARSQGLHMLPLGETMAILGTTFVGFPYEPGTLELPGPEGLVVNLREFDCVTLVEHLLVLGRLAVGDEQISPEDDEVFRERYRDELMRVRYRGGVLDGYPSRLHYFSEWLSDAEAKGLVRDVTEELGGEPDPRPIHFMSSNPAFYRQLNENPDLVPEIREMEERISQASRFHIPQHRIAEVEHGIENGDLIAAVSSIDGLDIAHTGIALWHDGRLHLLHAPLVGESVEISERPLAERIQRISGQTGIMVARPVAP